MAEGTGLLGSTADPGHQLASRCKASRVRYGEGRKVTCG